MIWFWCGRYNFLLILRWLIYAHTIMFNQILNQTLRFQKAKLNLSTSPLLSKMGRPIYSECVWLGKMQKQEKSFILLSNSVKRYFKTALHFWCTCNLQNNFLLSISLLLTFIFGCDPFDASNASKRCIDQTQSFFQLSKVFVASSGSYLII